MKNFLSVFVLSVFTFFSCEQNATPKIYPTKIGVDPAYADLLHKKVDEKTTLKQTENPSKNIAKTKAKNPRKVETKTTNVDKIIPLSKDNTQDTLKITYAKAKKSIVKKAGQTNTFVFNSDTAKKVAIKIWSKDTLANIRINHIKGPADSIKGGPFGKTLIFDLPAKGIYNFSVSEKPTISRTFAGEYEMELQLLWK